MPNATRLCSVEGCDRKRVGRGLCNKHYIAHRRDSLGDPVTLGHRFWSKVDRSGGEDACWIWTAHRDGRGYGRFESTAAHRVAYRISIGPIPQGLTIDHLCRNKGCVNPAHLEPVTNAENQRRAAEAQTHCKYGHEFTPENTYRNPSRPNVRHCRACSTTRGTEGYRRRNAPHLLGQTVGPKTHCKHGHEFTPENTYWYLAANRQHPRRECRACTKDRISRHHAARKGVA